MKGTKLGRNQPDPMLHVSDYSLATLPLRRLSFALLS